MENPSTEPAKYNAGASFRICGTGVDFEGITRELRASPDHIHRVGELDPGKRPYAQDMWSLKSPLGTTQELEAHLRWLAEVLLPHRDYIAKLRERYKVDIYCYKTCFTEQARILLSSKTLGIFTKLDLDLDVTLLCLPPEPRAVNETAST